MATLDKGGVEGGVGRFRRAHLSPVPTCHDLFSLNAQLVLDCKKDAKRTIAGKEHSVEQRWEVELQVLNPLPNKHFDTAEVYTPQVSRKSLVSVKGNFYSVPVSCVGQTIEARVSAQTVSIYKQGKLLATHARCYSQHKMITEIDHYLPLLKHKPGALSGSFALAQARQKKTWPDIYDHYWQKLLNKKVRTDANRLFIDFLWWARDFDHGDIEFVLKQTIATGSDSLDAIKLLMRRRLHQPVAVDKLTLDDLGRLASYERPVGSIRQYDALLTGAGVGL